MITANVGNTAQLVKLLMGCSVELISLTLLDYLHYRRHLNWLAAAFLNDPCWIKIPILRQLLIYLTCNTMQVILCSIMSTFDIIRLTCNTMQTK